MIIGGRELREDGSFELREDGSRELREGVFVEEAAFFRPLPGRRRDAFVGGGDLEVVVTLIPGEAHGSAAAGGATIEDIAAHSGTGPGAEFAMSFALAGNARAYGQIAHDRDLIDADLLAIAGIL